MNIGTDKDITPRNEPSMVIKVADITIDDEFSLLIPPLTKKEFAGLEESLGKDKFRDPLVVWEWEGKWILLDGHHRVKIGKKLNVEFVTVIVKKFRDRSEAKEWLINNQLSRRNLTKFSRIELAQLRESVIAARAKERMLAGKKPDPTQISAQGATREAVAKVAGVSHDTVRKAKAITARADEETKAKLRCNGTTTINKEYKRLAGAHGADKPGDSEWRTPPEYLEAARKVLGDFDYDPASKSGMEAVAKYGSGKVTAAWVFVHNETETESFQQLLAASSAVCFLKGAVRLLDPEGKPGGPRRGRTAIYMGPRAKQFISEFRKFGIVLRHERGEKETVSHREGQKAA